MALTAAYHDPVTEIGTDGFQSFTKLPAAVANKLLENDMWLKEPVGGAVSLAGNISTNSVSFVDASGLSITKTTLGGNVLILFTATVFTATSVIGSVSGRIMVDGVAVGPAFTQTCMSSGTVSDNHSVALAHLATGLAAGSHTFKIQWASPGGVTVQMLGGNSATLLVAEVGWK